MKRITFRIENLSPVNFAEKSIDSIFYATKKYIPGSAVKGALATEYINVHRLGTAAHQNEVFYNLFLSGKVRFLPAYPVFQDAGGCPFVLPFSLMQDKTGTRIRDLAAGEKAGAGYKKLAGMAVRNENEIIQINTVSQIEFHMSRQGEQERIAGRSIEGNVYNYEYLVPHQFFEGSFLADDDVEEALSDFLKLIRTLHLGRSKNTQYGECRIACSVAEDCENEEAVPTGCSQMYLYALTDFLPFGSWQNAEEAARQAVKTINTKMGSDVVELDPSGLFAEKTEINGFVGVWHAKRERADAIAAGSLFRVRVTPDALPALQMILYEGTGDRTSDGFGQFRLWCPPGDWVFGTPEIRVEKPVITGELKSKARQIIRNKILREVYKKASEDIYKINPDSVQKGKHIFKRIENLVDSDMSKNEILNEIRFNFKDTARKNLAAIKFGEDNLWELFSDDKIVQPYASIRWENRLELTEEQISGLKTDLGKDLFTLDENQLFRSYWLWFVRHAVKRRADESKPFNPIKFGGGAK